MAMADADEGLFRNLGLDEARQLASHNEKRLVLIDFYTVWCEPCKKLDETTWKDASVRAWLAKEAVCLKVDAEKNLSLAEKYRITAYPTVLLLKPDGTEVDRLVGYRDATTFLSDARDALAGNDSLSRARKKLEGAGQNNPMLRMSYGAALAEKGRAEDALAEYLWCFDHGLDHDRAFVGVRLSFLLARIAQLGLSHPPALDALRTRRDSAAKAIVDGKGSFDQFMSVTSLNGTLQQPEQTLSLYDRIKNDPNQRAFDRQYLLEQSMELLLKARRYKDVVAAGEPVARVRELIQQHEHLERLRPSDAGFSSYRKRQTITQGAMYYEALVGCGDHARAAEVGALLTTFDAVDAYPALVAAANRAGDAKTAKALAEEARKAIPPAPPKNRPRIKNDRSSVDLNITTVTRNRR
jgi:thiol-disulfide isomerase/thioredoxin